MKTRNRTIKIALAAVIALVLTAGTAFAGTIAVLDLQSCLVNSVKGKALASEFQVRKDEVTGGVKAKEAALKKWLQDFEKQAPLMTDEARTEKQVEFEAKRTQFQADYEAAQKLLQEESEKLTSIILKDLEVIVTEISEKNNYDLIINREGVWILYFNNSLDITEEVIRLYDEKSAAK